MTDHKAQALKNIDEGYIEVAEDNEVAISLALAQVHATLYLAEQQRIANLIAFVALNPLTKLEEVGAWSVDGEEEAVERNTARHAIREGLGLA